MSKKKMSLKKPFIRNVKTSELLHLGLYYYGVFRILQLVWLWCRPPHQEEMVAAEDLKNPVIT